MLRAAAGRFGDGASRVKARLLNATACRALADAATLVDYHDCLLYLLAYPDSAALLRAARAELRRVARAARTLAHDGTARDRRALVGSGLAWTAITIEFSYEIVGWLAERHPGHAEVDSFDAAGFPLADLLARALPPLEFELLARDGAASDELLAATTRRHRGSRLGWLVATLARLRCDEALRSRLFDALRVYTTVSPRGAALSRTFVRGLRVRPHFHRGPLERNVDADTLVAAALPPATRLSARERGILLDAARAQLAMLGRETDAITHADAHGVRHFRLGRGAAIALYSMRASARPPLDSHVGFMLFKNGVPIAYGGGWPFLGACKIGVNIFAPFRGGESASLFCQVLRTYRHCFAVERFAVEPYQFGAGNPEGIRSGAFWFYYRLNFRPVDPGLARLAASEFAKMAADPRYRSPPAILRRFARDDLEWSVTPRPRAGCEPADLSRAVTAWIDTAHGGDRAAAQRAAQRQVAARLGAFARLAPRAAEAAVFRAWCPLLAQIPGLARWPERDKAALAALLRAKAGDEVRYFARLAAHRRLREALCAIAAAAPP